MTNTKDESVKRFYQLAVLLGCSSWRSERNLTAEWWRMMDVCNDFRYPAGFPSASVPLFFKVEPLSSDCSPNNSIFSRYWPFLRFMWLWLHTAPLRHRSLAYDCLLNVSLVAALSSTKTSSSQSFCYARFVDGSEILKKKILVFESTGLFHKDTVYSANR